MSYSIKKEAIRLALDLHSKTNDVLEKQATWRIYTLLVSCDDLSEAAERLAQDPRLLDKWEAGSSPQRLARRISELNKGDLVNISPV